MNINNDLQQSYQRRGCIFVYITILARCCGLIALTGLIFVAYLEWLGIGSLNSRVYITFVTIVVAYLELLWVFNKKVERMKIRYKHISVMGDSYLLNCDFAFK
ncbi:unnamed protein product [Adineta ricciae]|uniref:Uncharacterized protein n=1 Tax=Adineta ricciae TaxID=249248 RepID=A0A815BUW6_ADIRI|nr:unnamed protein product [Adineta ricciae]